MVVWGVRWRAAMSDLCNPRSGELIHLSTARNYALHPPFAHALGQFHGRGQVGKQGVHRFEWGHFDHGRAVEFAVVSHQPDLP